MSTAAPETPVKTPEQLAEESRFSVDDQAAANQMARDVLFGADKTKKTDPETPPVTPAATPAAAAPETPAAPAAAVKKKKAKPAPPVIDRPDPEEIIERTAAATAKVITDAIRPQTPAPGTAAPDTSFMTDSEKRKLPVLERMAAMYPDRYKDITRKYVDNLKAIAEYQSAWEKENPGEAFDPDDKQHNDFYAKHELGWDEDDETEARVEMAADKRIKAIEEKTGAKLTELEAREKRRELEPQVFAESKRVGKQVFDIVGGAFKDLLNENGYTKADVLKKIQDEDPLAAQVIFNEVSQIEAWAAENYKLFNGAVAFDAQNPVHGFLAKFAAAQEQDILALPKEEQRNAEGKKFAKSTDFVRMPEEKRASYYTLSVSELNNLLAAEFGAKAAKALESERKRIDEMAQKYGYTKANGATPLPVTPPPVEDDAPAQITTTRVPITTPGANGNIPAAKTVEETFVSQILGR